MDCEQFLKVSSYYSKYKHLIKQSSDSKLRPVGAIAINTNTVTSSIYVILAENRDTRNHNFKIKTI